MKLIASQITVADYNDECTGCGCCYNACPYCAIEFIRNDHGFLRPMINTELCTMCGVCEDKCPVMHTQYDNNDPQCYAIEAEDDVREKCSSGGFFYVIAKKIISEKGSVCGACFDNNFKLKHIVVDSISDLDGLCGSKYLQSDVSTVYEEIKHRLSYQKVLFVGCPCQVAGIKSYIGENDRLITIDLICHGVPSPMVFEKYLDEYHKGDITDIKFRSKKYGWSSTFSIVYKDGVEINERSDENLYYRLFHSNVSLQKSCYNCHFSKIPRQGDVSIGDYWGIEQEYDDGKGVSLVLINNERGMKIMDSVKDQLSLVMETCLQHASKANPCVLRCVDENKVRNFFFEELEKKSLKDVMFDIDNKLFDIGLVIHNSRNYGNNLTNYSLYRYIKSKKFTVMIIPNNDEKIGQLFKYERFDKFEISDMPFYRTNDHCRMYLVGSDQTFAYWCLGDRLFTILPWARSDKYIASYGASFGKKEFDCDLDEYRKRISCYLKRFDAISVREQSALDILKSFGVEGNFVLDPIFLTDRCDYQKLSESSEIDFSGDYVGAYILDIDSEKEALIKRFKEINCVNKEYVIVDASYEQKTNLNMVYEAKVEDLIKMIFNSKFFITDSFHGVCLALILNKQFYVSKLSSNRPIERIASILSLVNMKDLLHTDPDDIATIDYDKINIILSKEKEKSIRWFDNILSNGLKSKREPSVYDYLIEENYELQHKISLLESRLNESNVRLDDIDHRMNESNVRLDDIDHRTNNIDSRLNEYCKCCDERIDLIEQKVFTSMGKKALSFCYKSLAVVDCAIYSKWCSREDSLRFRVYQYVRKNARVIVDAIVRKWSK